MLNGGINLECVGDNLGDLSGLSCVHSSDGPRRLSCFTASIIELTSGRPKASKKSEYVEKYGGKIIQSDFVAFLRIAC